MDDRIKRLHGCKRADMLKLNGIIYLNKGTFCKSKN